VKVSKNERNYFSFVISDLPFVDLSEEMSEENEETDTATFK
jgi:hypothetical protein